MRFKENIYIFYYGFNWSSFLFCCYRVFCCLTFRRYLVALVHVLERHWRETSLCLSSSTSTCLLDPRPPPRHTTNAFVLSNDARSISKTNN